MGHSYPVVREMQPVFKMLRTSIGLVSFAGLNRGMFASVLPLMFYI